MTGSGKAYDGTAVCVTGGAGFIGAHLAEALVARGAQVTVIDDLSNGRRSNLDAVAERVRLVQASILDERALEDALGGAAVVFHLAAVASVPRSVREPDLYLQVNALGTQRVLESARRLGVQRVVYSASSSVYGDQPGLPRVESLPPDPRSPYAAAKCTGEHLATAYAHCYPIDTVSLRYFNIFGPRQRPDSAYAAVVPRFTDLLRRGERPVIYGDGTQTRDFTYVANAVDANLRAGRAERPLHGAVLNIACGRSYSVLELIEAIAGELGVEAAWDTAAPRTGEVQDSLADIGAAQAAIGYEPRVSFHDGLRETVRWYAAHGTAG